MEQSSIVLYIEVDSIYTMNLRNSSITPSIIEQYKKRMLDKFHSTAKLLFWGDIVQLLFSSGLFLFYFWKYYSDIPEKLILSLVLIVILLTVSEVSLIIQTHHVIKDVQIIYEEKINLDHLYDLIFKLYKKRNFFSRETRKKLKTQRYDYFQIDTLQKEIKIEFPYTIASHCVILFSFSALFGYFILLGDIEYGQIFTGICGIFLILFFFIVDYFHYKNSKQWIQIFFNIVQWQNQLINYPTVKKKSAISLLEEDFDSYKEKNIGDLE